MQTKSIDYKETVSQTYILVDLCRYICTYLPSIEFRLLYQRTFIVESHIYYFITLRTNKGS